MQQQQTNIADASNDIFKISEGYYNRSVPI